MYFVRGAYVEAAAFVLGVDAGNGSCLLYGFREWLLREFRRRGESLLERAGHSDCLSAGFRDMAPVGLLPEQDKLAVDLLFKLLIAFLEERQKDRGPAVIFGNYAIWSGRK
jgi:hypothetical protein